MELGGHLAFLQALTQGCEVRGGACGRLAVGDEGEPFPARAGSHQHTPSGDAERDAPRKERNCALGGVPPFTYGSEAREGPLRRQSSGRNAGINARSSTGVLTAGNPQWDAAI